MTLPISYFFEPTETYSRSCRKFECQKSTKYVIDAMIFIPFLILGILGASGVLPAGFSASLIVPAVMALLYVGYVIKSRSESALKIQVGSHNFSLKSSDAKGFFEDL